MTARTRLLLRAGAWLAAAGAAVAAFGRAEPVWARCLLMITAILALRAAMDTVRRARARPTR
jgi:hypothetical protein